MVHLVCVKQECGSTLFLGSSNLLNHGGRFSVFRSGGLNCRREVLIQKEAIKDDFMLAFIMESDDDHM